MTGRPTLAAALALTAAALLAGLVTAAPAGADGAGPTDYRSRVSSVVPRTDAVRAEVRGGDSFLEVRVAPGHEVVVFGYDDRDGDGAGDDPYLRVRSDGTVERNRLSPATYLNEDRRGGVEVPTAVTGRSDPTATDWERIGGGGRYAWHDHRIHWMAPGAPPGVARGEVVGDAYDPWVVPLRVDGHPTRVEGRLVYAHDVSPWGWLAAAVALAAVVGLVGRRAPVRVAGAALLVAAALALVTGRAEFVASPAGVGADPLRWVLPAVAVAGAAGATWRARRPAGVVAALAAVAALGAWALLRAAVLTRPVLPTDLPAGLDRASVAAAAAVAVAGAWLAVSSGMLRLPDLDEADPVTASRHDGSAGTDPRRRRR